MHGPISKSEHSAGGAGGGMFGHAGGYFEQWVGILVPSTRWYTCVPEYAPGGIIQ